MAPTNQTQFIEEGLKRLIRYVEAESYCGYDPYDALNSSFNFKRFGKLGPIIATQIQVRNPVNVRPLIGITKGYNPKGMGLFLKSYCNLYAKTGDRAFLHKADWIFNWLMENYSRGFSGMGWGYNFPWAGLSEFKKAFLPSVVVTAHVVDGLYAYFALTKNEKAGQAIISAADYVKKDIPVTSFQEGISFAYTHQSTGACYNASLHAAEILLKASLVRGEKPDKQVEQAAMFVLARQKSDGSWYYSYDPESGTERRQIDFHQGFILVSLHNIRLQGGILNEAIRQAVKKGLEYYRKEQFLKDGRSLWRVPVRWPVDIHNQSQGIITFALLRDYGPDYLEFAKTIADWTINKMQHKTGYFYYRKNPLFTNKISYMRWSQAWMLLALSELMMVV